jgi:hypothetical protein
MTSVLYRVVNRTLYRMEPDGWRKVIASENEDDIYQLLVLELDAELIGKENDGNIEYYIKEG